MSAFRSQVMMFCELASDEDADPMGVIYEALRNRPKFPDAETVGTIIYMARKEPREWCVLSVDRRLSLLNLLPNEYAGEFEDAVRELGGQYYA